MALIIGTDPETGRTLTYTEAARLTAEREGKVEDIGFDADGIDKVIQRLEDIVEKKTDAINDQKRADSRALERTPPKDWGSRWYLSDVADFKRNRDDFNEKFVKRLKWMIENLRKVKKDYMEREDEIGQRFCGGLKD